jgi:hypothetical protein
MLVLAQNCGYKSIAELHSNEVSVTIDEFMKDDRYMKWEKNTKDRYKFEVIVKNCQDGIAKYIEPILEIIQNCVDPKQDPEMRADTLILV